MRIESLVYSPKGPDLPFARHHVVEKGGLKVGELFPHGIEGADAALREAEKVDGYVRCLHGLGPSTVGFYIGSQGPLQHGGPEAPYNDQIAHDKTDLGSIASDRERVALRKLQML